MFFDYIIFMSKLSKKKIKLGIKKDLVLPIYKNLWERNLFGFTLLVLENLNLVILNSICESLKLNNMLKSTKYNQPIQNSHKNQENSSNSIKLWAKCQSLQVFKTGKLRQLSQKRIAIKTPDFYMLINNSQS